MASNLTLYYIPGLTRLDTPTFDTIQHQEMFFIDQEKSVVSGDGFYVPKFKDRITLSTNDLTFNSAYNYLKISFNNKDYYYFINTVEYISEDVVAIDIFMDVIQTYMFDINFVSSEISRLSIKRWSQGTINRDYIRENYSNDTFTVQSIAKLFSQTKYGVVLLKLSDFNSLMGREYFYGSATDRSLPAYFKRTKVSCNGKEYYDKAGYIFVPFSLDSSTKVILQYKNVQTSTVEEKDELPFSITDMLAIPNAIDAMIIPGALLPDIGFTVTQSYNSQTQQTEYRIHDTNYNAMFDIYADPIGQYDTPYCRGFIMSENTAFTLKNKIIFPIKSTTHTFTFYENASRSTPFSWYYCPALLDENFIRFEYGERGNLATYPLHTLSQTSLNLSACYDITSNTRMYRCDAFAADDPYYTTIYARTIESIGLYNSPYADYISQNQSTLTRGIALTKARTLWDTTKSAVREAMSSRNAAELAIGEAGIIGDALLNLYSIDANKEITLENLKATPSSSELLNTGILDELSGMLYPIKSVKVCTNIQHCAELLESLGYKVQQISNQNLLQINNRYYYDIVQTSDMNINLTCLSDENTLYLIKARFQSGLRLWHTTNGDLNCKSVAGVTMDMGQVCKYDNVEV